MNLPQQGSNLLLPQQHIAIIININITHLLLHLLLPYPFKSLPRLPIWRNYSQQVPITINNVIARLEILYSISLNNYIPQENKTDLHLFHQPNNHNSKNWQLLYLPQMIFHRLLKIWTREINPNKKKKSQLLSNLIPSNNLYSPPLFLFNHYSFYCSSLANKCDKNQQDRCPFHFIVFILCCMLSSS